MSGTSVATPFVTGVLALLWSIFPNATAHNLKYIINHSTIPQKRSIIPTLLNAEGSYTILKDMVD